MERLCELPPAGLTRYLLETQNAYVKLRIQNDDTITVKLVGYSDSDWAGDPSSRKSQSSGHVEADGCPLTSFSRGKDKGKANAKTTKHFHGYCLVCKAWEHAMKGCWWNESAKSGKDTPSLETPITPAENTKTQTSITGMLMQSDEGETVPANPSQWLYSVTIREPSHEEFFDRFWGSDVGVSTEPGRRLGSTWC